jgi:dienelactone hydrolase
MNRAFARIAGVAAVILLVAGCSEGGGKGGAEIVAPAQTAYPPPAGKGRVVVVLSGRGGPRHFRPIAAEIAALGYYTVLLDGSDIPGWNTDGDAELAATIRRAQQSANALPGKAVVVGFSLGGGGALINGTRLPDLVAAVVAWYPATYYIGDDKAYVAGIKVPTLILAGGKDSYGNCCMIDTMRTFEKVARELGKPLDLVVYPQADHGFNLPILSTYRPDDAADGMRRTAAVLRQYLGP